MAACESVRGALVLRSALVLCALCAPFVMHARTASGQRAREVKVPAELLRQMFEEGDYKEELEPKGEFTLEGLSKRLAAEAFDLDRDGKPEYIVHGLEDVCGPYWCAHWVYAKGADGFRLLLDAGDVQTIEPQKTFTRGHRDLMAYRHGSAFDSGLSLYKFDGKSYRLSACFESHFAHSENARGRSLTSGRPTVKRVKCEPEE